MTKRGLILLLVLQIPVMWTPPSDLLLIVSDADSTIAKMLQFFYFANIKFIISWNV